MAENETCTPRDHITNEKTRFSKLEYELRDWRSNCSSRKGILSEVSFREVDEFERKDLEDHQSNDYNKVNKQDSSWRTSFRSFNTYLLLENRNRNTNST